MSSFRYRAEIFAPPDHVWNVLIDVERWPQWTPTVTRVARLDSGPLALGSRTRLWQPKLMSAVWKVTARDDQARLFVWEAFRPGVRVIARHHAELAPGGSTLLTLELAYRGLLGRLMALQLKDLNWDYLTKEAKGLKAHCEDFSW
jgi:uncharacterized membrane protein